MSGSGYPVGGGKRTKNDGRGIILPGEASSASTVFGVRGVDGVGVAVSTPTDEAWEGNRRETALGDHGPGQRAMHL